MTDSEHPISPDGPSVADDAESVPPDADDDAVPANPVSRLVAGAEPVVARVASRVGSGVRMGVRAAARGWGERPGARVRRMRRLARVPLPSLFDVHPEARQANPRELGLRTIDVADIRGTAVAGATQRGADFLPLKPFRSSNWHGRWQRIRAAVDRLAVLPPIDVVRFGDGYWVSDGHNRVAAALYAGQVGIDANVTELVPLGASPSERSASLAPALIGSRELRTAATGRAGPVLQDHELQLERTNDDRTMAEPEPEAEAEPHAERDPGQP